MNFAEGWNSLQRLHWDVFSNRAWHFNCPSPAKTILLFLRNSIKSFHPTDLCPGLRITFLSPRTAPKPLPLLRASIIRDQLKECISVHLTGPGSTIHMAIRPARGTWLRTCVSPSNANPSWRWPHRSCNPVYDRGPSLTATASDQTREHPPFW